jgi:hypothetical protein
MLHFTPRNFTTTQYGGPACPIAPLDGNDCVKNFLDRDGPVAQEPLGALVQIGVGNRLK